VFAALVAGATGGFVKASLAPARKTDPPDSRRQQ